MSEHKLQKSNDTVEPNDKNFKNVKMPKRPKASMSGLKRVVSMLWKSYPVLIPITAICIILSSLTNALPAVFQQI